MTRNKERLYKVIVIGANPAGILATNKLAEMGIPVTLVDREADLDGKLSSEQWRLPCGVPLNFAHRPGLLRILRNQAIQCLLPAEVVSLKHTPQGFKAHLRLEATYTDPARCTLCGRCAEVCPVLAPDGARPIRFTGRNMLPGRILLEKRQAPRCQTHCPLGVNAQAYIALAAAGRYAEALQVVRDENVLPGICGRVCTHPCEEACRRGELDEPIAIRDIKRFLADYEIAAGTMPAPHRSDGSSGRVAVVGSGPAALAAAAEAARLDYDVTVFEREPEPGGLLRYGIGPHRLPRAILDYELDYIRRMGIVFETARPVAFKDGLAELRAAFDGVIVAAGSWNDRSLGVPGEDLEGIEGCLAFLQRAYRSGITAFEDHAAVIGDGNAAFDLARVLRRMGAEVTLLSWFPKELIPADPREVEAAAEEGVQILDRLQVTAFEGSDGKLRVLRCRPTEPGKKDPQGIPWPVIVPDAEPVLLPFDRAFIAIGQKGGFPEHSPAGEQGSSFPILETTSAGLIAADPSGRTSIPFVYAAGDAVASPGSVVSAMAAGKTAARSLHLDLKGEDAAPHRTARPEDLDYRPIPPEIPSLARPTMPERQPAARSKSFDEVALGLSAEQAASEAGRCLQCGLCSECLLCVEACHGIDAIRHGQRAEDLVEQAGAVILADPDMVPEVKGLDVIRAYGPKSARPNVFDMMTRGFDAAAQAVILLSSSARSLRGRGLSFSPPDPELARDVRIRVFVCRCNGSLGWLPEMDRFVLELPERENVIFSSVIDSACVPEGGAEIVHTIREKGITRVVLASCVCCPLNFVCSACTDQRTRLKQALFDGTGISRSMVETCNLRGEALRFLKQNDPETAFERFQGLLDRSIHRAARLKALPAPARHYNFATAVVGESEAAFQSARILADSGLEVFMFGSMESPLSDRAIHPNIHWFKGSRVTGLTGSLGNFQLFVATDGFEKTLQVGAVILGEKSRRMIPYVPQKGLPHRMVQSSMQSEAGADLPFLYPGATSVSGLFLANPPDIRVSERKKGAAAAVLAAAVMPRGPRASRGYTVMVHKDYCRGCGRCLDVCPHQAIHFEANLVGGRHAVVDEALCKGCGLCISVCPSQAADSPYRDHGYLVQLLEEVLTQEKTTSV